MDSLDHKIHTKLLQAVRGGDVETAESLLNNIDSLKLRKYYVRKNRQNSLLHVAAAEDGQNAIVKLLLEYLDVNYLTDERETALMLAIEGNHVETVELLFSYGANTNIPDLSVYTCLFQRACINGRGKMVKILLENGVRLYSHWTELDPASYEFSSIGGCKCEIKNFA